MMLDFAGILGGGVFINTEADQKIGQHGVAFVNALSARFAAVREGDKTVFVCLDQLLGP